MLSILFTGNQILLTESAVCSLSFGWLFSTPALSLILVPQDTFAISIFFFFSFLNHNQLNRRQITVDWEILRVKIYIKDYYLCLEKMIITWKEVKRRHITDLSI